MFGEVSEGMDVLMNINEAYCDEEHRPYKDIRIYHTIVLDDPYEDPEGLEVPDRSPEPTQEQLDVRFIDGLRLVNYLHNILLRYS